MSIALKREAVLVVLAIVVTACAIRVSAVEPGASATTQPARARDERLKESLLGGESSNKDAAEVTVANMGVAAERLSKELDPGEKTQQIQKEIVGGIDRMVEQARQNRPSKRSASNARRKSGRRPPGQRPPAPKQGGDNRSASANAQPSGSPTSAPAQKPSKQRARKDELARGWGFLPERDREEVSQGFDEDFIEKYREEIIRYYRDLAKAAEKK